jgi:transposase
MSNEQWHILQLMSPQSNRQAGGPGRPPLDLRRVLDGIFYVNKTGCQWRKMSMISAMG